MIKAFIPTYHAVNIFQVEPRFFSSIGIKNLLIDLDNTLASYRDLHPKKNAVTLIDKLRIQGYNIMVISNNKEHRVRTYASELGVNFLSSSGKPGIKKLQNLLTQNKFGQNDTLLIGDQLLTDVLVASRLGIRVMLTEKIVPEDQWTTKFNRLIDRPLRKYLKKKGLLKEWDAHE